MNRFPSRVRTRSQAERPCKRPAGAATVVQGERAQNKAAETQTSRGGGRIRLIGGREVVLRRYLIVPLLAGLRVCEGEIPSFHWKP